MAVFQKGIAGKASNLGGTPKAGGSTAPPNLVRKGKIIIQSVKPPILSAPKIDIQQIYSTGENAEVKVTMTGLSALRKNLELLSQACKDAAGLEASRIAQEVIIDAQDNYVPVDTGNLHDSGGSTIYEPGSTTPIDEIQMWFGEPPTTAEIGAGVGDASKYAYRQHEDLDLHHPPMDSKTGFPGGPTGIHGPSPGTGGPKYLEQPFDAIQPTIVPRVAAAVDKVLATMIVPTDPFADLESSLRNAPSYPGYGAR